MILAQKIAGGRGKRGYHHRRDEKRAIWKRTAAVIAKPNTQEHSIFSTNSALCPAIQASMPFACWAHQPSCPNWRPQPPQLGENEAPFYTWKKKHAYLGK